MLPPVLSRRLAFAMQVLINHRDFDLDTQWRMYAVFDEIEAEFLSDYPNWIVDLVLQAERGKINGTRRVRRSWGGS